MRKGTHYSQEFSMTIADVQTRVKASQDAWKEGGFSKPLNIKSDLYRDLLYAIATGEAEDPKAMAAAALQLTADEALPGPRP